MAGVAAGLKDEELFHKDQLTLDAGEWFSTKEGKAQAYIIEVATFFADSLPAVSSETSSVDTKIVHYKSIKNMYTEYEYQCEWSSPVVTADMRASYATFVRAWKKLHKEDLVRLMGGKGGFQTCAICNHCIEIKRSAQCKHDLVTVEVSLSGLCLLV